MAITLPSHELNGADRGREVALAAVVVLQVLERAIVDLGHVGSREAPAPAAPRAFRFPKWGRGAHRPQPGRPGRGGRRRGAPPRESCRCRASHRRRKWAAAGEARKLAGGDLHLEVLVDAEEEDVHPIGLGASLFGRHLDIEKTSTHVKVGNLGGKVTHALVELLVELERAVDLVGIEMVEPFVAGHETWAPARCARRERCFQPAPRAGAARGHGNIARRAGGR